MPLHAISPGPDRFRGARGIISGNQSVAASTLVPVDFDGTDTYDTDNFHDPSSNPTRFTIPIGLAGYYHITGAATYGAWAGGAGTVRQVFLRVNGTDYIANNGAPPISAGQVSIQASQTYRLSQGDYVELIAYQDSSGAINIVDATYTFFDLFRVGQ